MVNAMQSTRQTDSADSGNYPSICVSVLVKGNSNMFICIWCVSKMEILHSKVYRISIYLHYLFRIFE